MVVYLPIAFFKDWFFRKMKSCSSRSGRSTETDRESTEKFGSPLKFALELEANFTRKDAGLNLSLEDQKALLDGDFRKHDKELTTWDIVRYGFYLAPLWFLVEVTESPG